MEPVLSFLDTHNIAYKLHTHAPFFTVKDSRNWTDQHTGAHVKNLFLNNTKKTEFYLVIMLGNKRLDLKKLEQTLGHRLSFASPERLMNHLGVTPGSVSPMTLIHPNAGETQVYIDDDILSYKDIFFHPNQNDKTLQISLQDFQKFLDTRQNTIDFITV